MLKKKKNKSSNLILNNFTFYNDIHMNTDIIKKFNTLKFNLLKKKKNSKLNYVFFFNKYSKVKNNLLKIVNKYLLKAKLYNKLLLSNKSKFKILYSKYNFYKNYIYLSKKFCKNITFNFKNLMINNKYSILYNLSLIENKKFNLFSLYNYKKNINIPFIYDYFFEENLIEGPVLFNINHIDYIYLNKSLYKLYFYFKWMDNSFLNNKGSFY